MAIPHPIPYQGSKRNLADKILSYFPNDINRLIEPFVGSAAISIASAHQQKAQKFVLNDINEALIMLWREMIYHPQALSQAYTTLWHKQLGHEKEFYNKVRDRFNKTHRPYYFLYLLARCVKASVRYNANGEFNQSPDNRRKGRNPQAMCDDIMQVSRLFTDKTQLFSMDYRKILTMANPDDLVYMDPPYQGVSQTSDPRYYAGINQDEFISALDELNQRNISYIVSYDGRTGQKSFGNQLPEWLKLTHIELNAGRSSQSTLLGRSENTMESLYLSPVLHERIADRLPSQIDEVPKQLSFMDLIS